jgi:hypothetical protein
MYKVLVVSMLQIRAIAGIIAYVVIIIIGVIMYLLWKREEKNRLR